jgi:hypothetical protein
MSEQRPSCDHTTEDIRFKDQTLRDVGDELKRVSVPGSQGA